MPYRSGLRRGMTICDSIRGESGGVGFFDSYRHFAAKGSMVRELSIGVEAAGAIKFAGREAAGDFGECLPRQVVKFIRSEIHRIASSIFSQRSGSCTNRANPSRFSAIKTGSLPVLS